MGEAAGDGEQMMLLALLVAASAATQTPTAFVQSIYGSYRDTDFSPFKHPDRYFAPRLKAAIDEDSRLAKDEVGYLDGDPICQCQDTDGLRPKILRVRTNGRDSATADVLLDYTDSTARRIRLSLVHTKTGWRIADITAGDEGSLLRALEASNRKARKR